MRQKRERSLSFPSNPRALPKTVREYREKYNRISQVLDEHPEILDWGHRDLATLSQGGRKGRKSDFTSEKFITDYEVYEHRLADCELTETVLDRHEALLGEPPEVRAGDQGFCPDARPTNNGKHAWGRSPFPAGCVISPTR